MGGGGVWNDTISQWYNGASATTWNPGTDAWFAGGAPGGTVTLGNSNGEIVGNMVFNTSGYTLSGSTLTIFPNSGSPGTVTANQNVTINSSIADNGGGVTFTGSHVVTLGAAYDTGLTGPITVSSGTLLVNGTNPGLPAGLYNASSININGGATLVANTNNALFGYPAQGQTYINPGALLTSPSGINTHLNAVQLDGGTLSTGGPNYTYGSWQLDRGVTTPGNGDDRTSYIVGGNLCLSESTGGGTQFNVGSGDTLYVGAQITLCTGLASSTQFSLINGGVGTLVLAASNNFTASTQTSNGTLVLANTAALSASPLVINGGYVAFSGITQNFPLVSLSGNGGTLVLANTNNSPVNVSVGSSTTYSGALTGSGSLTVTGGNLTLGGNNNYNATILAGGVLTLGGPSAAGTGAMTFSGGTLQYTSAANGIADLSPQFSTAASQKYNIDTGGLSLTFSGSLKSSGGILTKFGLGELTLSGSGNASAATTVNIIGGVLQFASPASVPDKFATISISSAGAGGQFRKRQHGQRLAKHRPDPSGFERR